MAHRKYVPYCRWRNAVAVLMAAVTAGVWIPYINDPARPAEDDDESASVPAPLFESHAPPTWPEKVVPRPPVVSLIKHPKPVHNPVVDPTHSQPTPKVPVRIRPVVRPPLNKVATLVDYLQDQIGKPYVFGGNGPLVFDCSGLTKAAYAHIGIYLPRTSQQQSLVGDRVPLSELLPGDLVFYGVVGIAFHVGVYVGNGQIIAAENPATGVIRYNLGSYVPSFARRIL